MAASVLVGVGIVLYLAVSSVWRWLFPPDPLLEPLADRDLPEWVTGSVPPGDATVSFDVPAGWEPVDGGPTGAGEEAAASEGLHGKWRYDPDHSPRTVEVEVDFHEGLAGDDAWPGGNVAWKRIDLHDLDAYVGSPSIDNELWTRTGSWRIVVRTYDDVDDDFLKAVAERVRFDPGSGGEDDPDFQAMTADSDLSEVCRGGSFPDGASYEGPAPHPTQVLRSASLRVAAENLYTGPGTADAWPDTWPPEWAPGTADAREIQLVACVEDEDRRPVDTGATCHYDLPLSVDHRVVAYADPVVVREVRTGRVVAEGTATATPGPCPERVEIEIGQDELTWAPSLGDYLAVVEPSTFG
ncbi:MAG TPA: hypothetical protein VIL36_08710 [Acidimicrobiales bacterium]